MTTKLTLLQRRLKVVKEKFDALKASGIDEEILICYLKQKTKLSTKQIKLMLYHQEEFYDKLISDAAIAIL